MSQHTFSTNPFGAAPQAAATVPTQAAPGYAPPSSVAAPAPMPAPGSAFPGQVQAGAPGLGGFNPLAGMAEVDVGGLSKDYLSDGLYVLRTTQAKVNQSKRDGAIRWILLGDVLHAVGSRTHVRGSTWSWAPKLDPMGKSEIKACLGATVLRLHPVRQKAECNAGVTDELTTGSVAVRGDGQPAMAGFVVACRAESGQNAKTGKPFVALSWRPVPLDVLQRAQQTGWTDELVRQLALS